MTSKKDITISNAAFTITIHWNGQIIATQLCILAGVLLLKWITKNQNVHVLCNVVLIVDLLSVLIVLFMGGNKEEKTEENKSSTTPSNKASTEKPAEKGETKKNEKGSAHEEKVTVKKRVPLPTQQGVQRQQAPAPEPESEPIPESSPPPMPSMDEMSEDQLTDLFNF